MTVKTRPPPRDPATSFRLSRVKQTDTRPEIVVRHILARLGLGYRIRNRDLPGSPDIANRHRRWAIFVHGCFWHQHEGCRKASRPKNNEAFWTAKFLANKQRDINSAAALKVAGFDVMVIWECETKAPKKLCQRVAKWAASIQ